MNWGSVFVGGFVLQPLIKEINFSFKLQTKQNSPVIQVNQKPKICLHDLEPYFLQDSDHFPRSNLQISWRILPIACSAPVSWCCSLPTFGCKILLNRKMKRTGSEEGERLAAGSLQTPSGEWHVSSCSASQESETKSKFSNGIAKLSFSPCSFSKGSDPRSLVKSKF